MKVRGRSRRNASPCGKADNPCHGRTTHVTYVIMSPCEGVKDGACVKVCPVDCIHEGETMFYIDPVECIACGLCETICPEDAIRPIEEVPAEEAGYIEKNAAFFKRS